MPRKTYPNRNTYIKLIRSCYDLLQYILSIIILHQSWVLLHRMLRTRGDRWSTHVNRPHLNENDNQDGYYYEYKKHTYNIHVVPAYPTY